MRKSGKKVGFLASLLALTLILMTGCGGAKTGGNESPKATGNSKAAKEVKEVKVGWLADLSGTSSAQGEGVKRGVDMALEMVNNSGGIKSLGGAKLVVDWGDGQSTTEKAVGEAERLSSDSAVSIIMGTQGSGPTLAASQVSERKAMPFINGMASSSTIYKRGFKHVWGYGMLAEDYARMQVEYYKVLRDSGEKIDRIAVVYQDSEYGKTSVAALKKSLAEVSLQGNLVADLSYAPAATDLTPVISKVKAAKPQMVILIAYLNDALKVYKTMDQLDFHPIILGAGGAAGDPRLVELLKEKSEGLIAVDQWSVDRKNVTELNEKYKAKNGADMDTNSALGYQGVLFVRAILEAAGSTDKTAIENAIRNINLQPGPDLIIPQPAIKFAADGTNVKSRPVVTQFQNGKKVTIYPKEQATGTLQLKK